MTWPDGRDIGFYFRTVTERLLFGISGHLSTLRPGRTQVNMLRTCKREPSRRPDEVYDVIEACLPRLRLELFAGFLRERWHY